MGFVFFLLGISSLVPWYTFVMAYDYYNKIFLDGRLGFAENTAFFAPR